MRGQELKEIIEQTNLIQLKRTIGFSCKNNRFCFLSESPPTKESGLYWIYTAYTEKEMMESVVSSDKKHVDIPCMTESHRLLNNVCRIKINGFRLIYNGIGGRGSKKSFGLRERILQEFNGGRGTGSLAIKHSSLTDWNKWKYSYVLWSEIKFHVPVAYEKSIAEELEQAWRIHYGWPLLCAR